MRSQYHDALRREVNTKGMTEKQKAAFAAQRKKMEQGLIRPITKSYVKREAERRAKDFASKAKRAQAAADRASDVPLSVRRPRAEPKKYKPKKAKRSRSGDPMSTGSNSRSFGNFDL